MPIFTANIPGTLQIGDRIEIGGKIKDNARKMSVNLCAQEGEEPLDVVLHFDVRFHRDSIISLSRKNGIWIGSGNYDTNYNMFVPGTIFRIVFEIKDTDVITIYCQGKFHSNFLAKIPLSMAHYIVAWADVEKITHCYFHLKSLEDSTMSGAKSPGPRPTLAGDASEKRRHCVHKDQPQEGSSTLHSSSSSETEMNCVKGKKNGRVDKSFYETLMCHPRHLSPEKLGRNISGERHRNRLGIKNDNSTRKYRNSDKTTSDE